MINPVKKKCLNCGYERQPEDESGFTHASECPKCHAIYEKVEKWLLKKEYEKAEEWLNEKGKDSDLKINFATKYSPIGIRFCAGLIDFIIFFITAWFLRIFDEFFGNDLVSIFIIILIWLYYSFLESSDLQASIGKKALGLIVADSEGRKITFWKATVRFFLFLLTIFNISGFMIAFSKKKQGFHDQITDTLVLQKKDYMYQYKIFKHPSGSTEAVKQGWLWPAFFFTWIWALFKKMWLLGAGVFIVFLVIDFIIISNLGIPKGYGGMVIMFIIYIIPGVIFGVNGSSWREKDLSSRGFEHGDTVTATNPEGAIAHFLKVTRKGN